MKDKMTNRPCHAFTLVEMLVVISVIGVLAALLFPAGAAIRKNGILRRAKAELSQLETGIENYKLKLGFYPPDNPGRPVSNQLYFELLGTVENTTNRTFETLDGSGQITFTPVNEVLSIFGRDAFSNLGAKKGAEEGVVAENFLKGTIKPGQVGELPSISSRVKVFVGSVPWPDPPSWQPTSKDGLNPWCYVSSNPTNNTKSYDLWVNLVISGKTYRISNWRKDPEVVILP